MRLRRALLASLALALLGRAAADPAVVVVDGTSSLAEFVPTPGVAQVRRTTTDPVTFSNAGADQREAVALSASHAFTYDATGATVSGSVPHQGGVAVLASLWYAAQSSRGAFLPASVVTAADATGQAGWTKHPTCGAVTYQGTFSIPWYSNAGAAQAPLSRHYQVCDATRIWVDSDQDMSGGADAAYLRTQATSALLTGESDYEVSLQGLDFLFDSAPDAARVTLVQGRYLAAPVPAPTTFDVLSLYEFPDAFPAGVETTTITASATDITS